MKEVTPGKATNRALWERYGDSLFVVQPFMDNLIERGEGCYYIDVEGRRILDLAAGQFCSVLGHNHPRFRERLQQQLDRIVHLGDQFVSPGVLEAAGRLAALAPVERGKVIFLSTGSEANECAMRIAKAFTGRTGMLGYTRGYYGISLATRNLSSISDQWGKTDFQPAPVNQHKLLTPICDRCPVGLEHSACTLACLDASFEMIGHHAENIAAVIIEPVISAGGMIYPSKEYIQALHARTREIGAVFIVDEAQTGFGRCGTWFDIQHYDVTPDILVISKTGGNGYPIGAVVVSDAIAKALEAQGFSHLSSHQNDPLAAAAVLAVIDTIEQEGLVEHSRATGDYFMAGLRSLQQKHPLVREVRGRGLMIGLELNADAGADKSPGVALAVTLLCEERKVHLTFTYHEPVLRFIPPLVISRGEIDQALAVLDEVFGIVEREAVDIAALMPVNSRSGPYVKRGTQGFTPARVVRGLWNTPPREWMSKFRKR